MNLDQMKLDIEERERLLKVINIQNPLYHVMYNSLVEKKEEYRKLELNEQSHIQFWERYRGC